MSNTKLFIGNLSFKLNESDLQIAFEEFGEIDEIRLITDRETKRSKGFAFVTFTNGEDAEKALCMNGVSLEGRDLRVNFAMNRNS